MRALRQPGDHYGRAERALSLYSPGLGAHSGNTLKVFGPVGIQAGP